MVVVVILGILAALVAPNVIRRIDDANVTKAKQDIRALRNGAQPVPHGQLPLPHHRAGSEALVKQPADPNVRNWKEGGYMQSHAEGSVGQRLCLHRARHARRDYDLYTLGADGQPGGEGTDADIGNWNIE